METSQLLPKVPGKPNSLYYPGCFSDFNTLRYFLEHSTVRDFYYCDYLNSEREKVTIETSLRNEFQDGEVTCTDNFTPAHFKKRNWEEFWYPHVHPSEFFGKIADSYIVKYAIRCGKRKANLYYFGTEAVETYRVLIQNGIRPDIVVLQNHGLGCLWTMIGGDDLIYDQSRQNGYMPPWLMVTEWTEHWPGYSQESEYFGAFGMHGVRRAFFKPEIG